MKLTMPKKAWKALWLEIAEKFAGKRSSYPDRYIGHCGFCDFLNNWGHCDLAETVERIGKNMYWYKTWECNGKPDNIRVFTACFIAEIGEKEFYRLAEEQ